MILTVYMPILIKGVKKLIINRLEYFRERKKPTKHEKYEEIIKYRKSNEQKKKLYNYYVCDYCKAEIEIKKQKNEMTGGTVVFPRTLTKKGDIVLALCNKCLNKALAEFKI